MPELPEVETTRRGIEPHLMGQKVSAVKIRDPRLRWPVPPQLADLAGQTVRNVTRRAKYILIAADHGTAIVHLGMSGSLRIADPEAALRPHDHLLLNLESGMQLRYHDPRRFGCWLWTNDDPLSHPLLRSLGPEPLGRHFTAQYLSDCGRNRRGPVKQLLMNPRTVVGIGNIYACEALYMAGIHPQKPSGELKASVVSCLVRSVRKVLRASIEQGGTTLRDFVREDGTPGYFRQSLSVYGRTGQPCRECRTPIEKIVIGQRSTFFCPNCQS